MNTKPFRMLLNLIVIAALALSLTPLTPTAARVAPESADLTGASQNLSGLTAVQGGDEQG